MDYDRDKQSHNAEHSEKPTHGIIHSSLHSGTTSFRLHVSKARDGSLKYQCFPAGSNRASSWGEVLKLWSVGNVAFIHEFQQALQASHDDVFWECAPVRHAAETFEFVIKDAKGALLQRTSIARQDSEYFDGTSVSSVRDLSSDAVLVSPKRISGSLSDHAYGHLVSFVRHAPHEQQLDLWREVAKQVGNHFQSSKQPLWVSTDGSRVPWLQVRLDTEPRHYKHAEYQNYVDEKNATPLSGSAGPTAIKVVPKRSVDLNKKPFEDVDAPRYLDQQGRSFGFGSKSGKIKMLVGATCVIFTVSLITTLALLLRIRDKKPPELSLVEVLDESAQESTVNVTFVEGVPFAQYIGKDYHDYMDPVHEVKNVGAPIKQATPTDCLGACVDRVDQGCNAVSYYTNSEAEAWPGGYQCYPKKIDTVPCLPSDVKTEDCDNCVLFIKFDLEEYDPSSVSSTGNCTDVNLALSQQNTAGEGCPPKADGTPNADCTPVEDCPPNDDGTPNADCDPVEDCPPNDDGTPNVACNPVEDCPPNDDGTPNADCTPVEGCPPNDDGTPNADCNPVEDCPPNDDGSPNDDCAPVENCPPNDDGSPNDDCAPVEDCPPNDDGTPNTDCNPVEDCPPNDDGSPNDDCAPVEDCPPNDDGTPSDDCAPVEDCPPSDDGTPSDDCAPVEDCPPNANCTPGEDGTADGKGKPNEE